MINQEDFLRGLLKCLVKLEVVHLPGFGVFRSSHKTANIDVMGGVINPPSKELTFTPSQTVNKESIQLIAKELEVSVKEIDVFFNELKITWNKRLANKEIIQLSGIGRIYKEFGGDLKFKQELNSDIFSNDELPVLNFRPLNRSMRSKLPLERKPSYQRQRTNKRSRKKKNIFSLLTNSELLPITIGAASFLVILAFYLLLPRQPDFTNQSLAEKVKVERINQKPSHQIEAEFAKDTFLDILKAEKDLEEEVAEVFEIDKESASDSSESIQDIKRISPKKLHQAIIITGAYRNFNGAKRKIKTLVAQGYNPYQDKKDDLHRVGITFSYREVREMQEYLLQIQENISPQAWILE